MKKVSAHHYTKITVVRLSIRVGASPPQRKKLCFSAKLKTETTSHGSLPQPAMALAPDSTTEARRTKQRSTNVLTSGGPKATKEQRLGFKIVHVSFVEVGDSLPGIFYLEFFRAKLLGE